MREAAWEPRYGLCKCPCVALPTRECTGEATSTLTVDYPPIPGGVFVVPVCDGCWQTRLDHAFVGG